MHGTRQRLLDLIIEQREARVEDLADALGITTAAVRRHLDNLRADGLIGVRSVRQATGRPYYVYHPTEAAVGDVHSAELLERMLRVLGGRDDVLIAVSESVAESVASKHRSEIEGSEPEERIVQVTESLRREGILETWSEDEDGFRLVNGQCPYRKAAEISPLPCESDRKVIELLVGQEVEQLHRIVDGSPICEYLVRAARGPQETIQVG